MRTGRFREIAWRKLHVYSLGGKCVKSLNLVIYLASLTKGEVSTLYWHRHWLYRVWNRWLKEQVRNKKSFLGVQRGSVMEVFSQGVSEWGGVGERVSSLAWWLAESLLNDAERQELPRLWKTAYLGVISLRDQHECFWVAPRSWVAGKSLWYSQCWGQALESELFIFKNKHLANKEKIDPDMWVSVCDDTRKATSVALECKIQTRCIWKVITAWKAW